MLGVEVASCDDGPVTFYEVCDVFNLKRAGGVVAYN